MEPLKYHLKFSLSRGLRKTLSAPPTYRILILSYKAMAELSAPLSNLYTILMSLTSGNGVPWRMSLGTKSLGGRKRK